MAAFAWLDKISSIMNDDFKLGLVPFLDSSMSSTVAILISLLGRCDFTVAYDKFNEILVLMKKWKTETPKSSLGRRSEGEGEPEKRHLDATLRAFKDSINMVITQIIWFESKCRSLA